MKSKIYQYIAERKTHTARTVIQGKHDLATVSDETEQAFIDRITAEINESGDFLIGIQYFTDSIGQLARAIITAKIVENK